MEIFICPRHLVATREPFEPTHLISIQDPGTPTDGLRPAWVPPENHLLAHFLDVRGPHDPDGPTPGNVAPILAWLTSRCGPGSPHRLLVHCHAGLGRSPAVGYLAWVIHLGPGHESEAWERMRASSHQRWVIPNGLIIQHAAKLLGRPDAILAPYLRWAREP